MVGQGFGTGMGQIPMTNGVPTANLVALLQLQQRQGLQAGVGMLPPGLLGAAPPAPMLGLSGLLPGMMVPPAELAALMMSTFTPKPENQSCTIYVGNLAAGITSDQLSQFFGSCPLACPSAAPWHTRSRPESAHALLSTPRSVFNVLTHYPRCVLYVVAQSRTGCRPRHLLLGTRTLVLHIVPAPSCCTLQRVVRQCGACASGFRPGGDTCLQASRHGAGNFLQKSASEYISFVNLLHTDFRGCFGADVCVCAV